MKFGLVLLALASLSLAAPTPDTVDALEARSADDALEVRSPDDDGDFREPPPAERELDDRELAKRVALRLRVIGSNVRCRSGTTLSSRVEYFVQKGEVYTSPCWSLGTRVSGSPVWWRLSNVKARGNSCYVHHSLLTTVSGPSLVGSC